MRRTFLLMVLPLAFAVVAACSSGGGHGGNHPRSSSHADLRDLTAGKKSGDMATTAAVTRGEHCDELVPQLCQYAIDCGSWTKSQAECETTLGGFCCSASGEKGSIPACDADDSSQTALVLTCEDQLTTVECGTLSTTGLPPTCDTLLGLAP